MSLKARLGIEVSKEPSWVRETFSPPNILLASLNILIFVVLQSCFYYLVISGLFETTVKNKGAIVKTYIDKAPASQTSPICDTIHRILDDNPVDAAVAHAREDHNIRLIALQIALPFAAPAFALVVLMAIVCFRQRSWNKYHMWSCLVLCTSIIIEVFIYFAVIARTIIIGDVKAASAFIKWETTVSNDETVLKVKKPVVPERQPAPNPE